jgi:hypothetical protein
MSTAAMATSDDELQLEKRSAGSGFGFICTNVQCHTQLGSSVFLFIGFFYFLEEYFCTDCECEVNND